MVDCKYVIYGKIIVDDVVVKGTPGDWGLGTSGDWALETPGDSGPGTGHPPSVDLEQGSRVRSVLGGGGPQAAFGARLWSDSVGFLSRSGDDLTAAHIGTLDALDIDLSGWRQFPDIPTPRTLMQYDDEEYLTGGLITSRDDWARLLGEPLPLPAAYKRPRAIHLVTEFPEEPMVGAAFDLRRQGTSVSLEPLTITFSSLDWDKMLALIGQVDLVTPDWPTASRQAADEDPKRVIQYWSRLGPAMVAVRHGARGSYVWSRDTDEAWHIPPVPTEVVDPTGAGNAYGGGLCVGWAATGDARQAGCYGAISAAMLVRQVGLPRMSTNLQHEAKGLIEQTVAATHRL
jgi:sugar/nucleoside kinase (ribokinase family)